MRGEGGVLHTCVELMLDPPLDQGRRLDLYKRPEASKHAESVTCAGRSSKYTRKTSQCGAHRFGFIYVEVLGENVGPGGPSMYNKPVHDEQAVVSVT